jgi:predicted Zn-dependent peptidase
MGFHMCGHQDEDYKVFDMLSDVLSNGKSTRLEQILVQELRLCTGIDAFITGTVDPGLFLISAKPATGVTTQQVEQAVWEQLERLKQEPVGTQEMEKVKNRYESEQIFNSLNYLNVANNLAYFELLGDANDFNREVEKYRAVTPERLMEVARRAFVPENCSVLHYLRNEESNPTQP